MKKLYPVIAALLFSGSFPAAKYTTYDLAPISVIFLRFLISLIFLIGVMAVSKRVPEKIRGKDLVLIVIAGLSGFVAYQMLFLGAVRYTAVTNTAVINAFNPVLTAASAAIFLNEKLRKINYLGIFLSLAGVLFLISKGSADTISNMDFNIGDLMMLSAVMTWVVYSLIIKSLISRYSAFTLTFYVTATAVAAGAVPAFAGGLVDSLSKVSYQSALGVIYMGIFASGVAHLLYNSGIREIGPTKTASVTYSLVPVFAACLSYLFFGEELTSVLFISLVLIIGGVNGVLRVKKETGISRKKSD